MRPAAGCSSKALRLDQSRPIARRRPRPATPPLRPRALPADRAESFRQSCRTGALPVQVQCASEDRSARATGGAMVKRSIIRLRSAKPMPRTARPHDTARSGAAPPPVALHHAEPLFPNTCPRPMMRRPSPTQGRRRPSPSIASKPCFADRAAGTSTTGHGDVRQLRARQSGALHLKRLVLRLPDDADPAPGPGVLEVDATELIGRGGLAHGHGIAVTGLDRDLESDRLRRLETVSDDPQQLEFTSGRNGFESGADEGSQHFLAVPAA